MQSLITARTVPSLSSALPHLIPRLPSLVSSRQMASWSLPRSLDRYLDEQYSPIGHVRQLPDGVQFYASGNTESHKAVIIISDMFGWKTGRIRNYADFFCELGYYVLIPRMLTISHPNEESTHHEDEEEANLKPKMKSMIRHLEDCGIQRISILSFSWGGWVTAHVLADEELAPHFSCAAIAHPSLGYEDNFGGSVVELLNRGDSNNYRPDGVYLETLRKHQPATECYDVSNEEHGFLPRGNIGRSTTYDSVCNTIERIVYYFEQHTK
eukprot:scaffold1185_cov177-Ochromonas_danica.AAC.1